MSLADLIRQWPRSSWLDIPDRLKPGREFAPVHERPGAPWIGRSPLEALEYGVSDFGRTLRDLRGFSRTRHYPTSEWDWFHDKLKGVNKPLRAKPYGKRTAAKTTCLMLHTTATHKIGWKRFLGIPAQFGVDGYGDAVLCHDIQTLVAHGHAGNSYCVGMEISGNSSATKAQIETARLMARYFRDEVRRRRRLESPTGYSENVYVCTHFNVTNKRGLADPGPQIWREVGEYCIDELGFKLGPVVSTGQPVPELWR